MIDQWSVLLFSIKHGGVRTSCLIIGREIYNQKNPAADGRLPNDECDFKPADKTTESAQTLQ